ncbi:caspase family protein [Nitrospina watsonii]|uniref:WD_REPEATS_REGION domain-containing protein n=1 Tax=Nitrospina watsonii TaxID=1323948 RepID=A0ABM9HA19_9BACT|nr:caspase family protein [Nitrospina watsonii]CAI2716970.1 WD_REPEATS_REGION domain-containing protein [Nitrospina watsonii]
MDLSAIMQTPCLKKARMKTPLLFGIALLSLLLSPTNSLADESIRTFTGHTGAGAVTSVAFSPDGRYALSGSWDATLKLWEIATGKEVRTFTGHTYLVTSVAFSPDGRYALSGSVDYTLKLWEVETGKEVRTFRGHKHGVTSVAFSPDGRYALSGSWDETLKLWEVATGKEVRTFTGHTSAVLPAAFSPDGQYALSGSQDNTLKLWEVATGKEIRTFTGHEGFVVSVAFSPDGRYALSGSHDKTLKLWEVATGKEIRTFTGHTKHTKSVNSVAFSPDGRYALSSGGGDKTLKLWEVETGREIRTIRGHKRGVIYVAFSPDGRYALSGSTDGTLKLWDLSPYIKAKPSIEDLTEEEIQAIQQAHDEGLLTQDQIQQLTDLGFNFNKPKDTAPPVLTITSHDMKSGVAVVPKVPSVLIAGKVEDESGIDEVTVNGVKAYMDASGNFSAEVPLENEDTKVQIVVRDEHGNTAWKNFWLKGVEVELPPQLAMVPKPSNMEELDVKGAFHAIVIGINNYQKLPKLRTAIRDAQAVDQILRENYGFSTHLLIDPDRDQMLEAFDRIRRKVGEDDHLLIYYAGHGVFDKTVDKAFWLPVDADEDSDIRWLIVDRITSTVRRMPAKHVLIVADSCYSGTLTRNIDIQSNTVHQFNRYLGKMFERTSRTLMASGGNEPVSDGGGSGHSVFAQAFLEALKNPGMKAFTAEQLFRDHLKERVAGASQQIPEYKIIQDSGHEGGDFVFIRKP